MHTSMNVVMGLLQAVESTVHILCIMVHHCKCTVPIIASVFFYGITSNYQVFWNTTNTVRLLES